MRITTYSVYIVSNYLRTVLYIGVTNNLVRRIAEHKSGKGSGFTARYNCYYLEAESDPGAKSGNERSFY